MSDKPHSPLCMCQACQDEALASEMRKDAETLRAVTAERDELREQLEKYQAALAGHDRRLVRQEKIAAELRRKLEAERDALQARIAQLEQSALTGYEDGWHALRNERDALRARIADAPVIPASTEELYAVLDGMMSGYGYTPDDVKVACFDVQRTVDTLTGTTRKRVALVPLGNDE